MTPTTWLRRLFYRPTLDDLCRCGHTNLIHQHYRAATDCGKCGRCERFRLQWPVAGAR